MKKFSKQILNLLSFLLPFCAADFSHAEICQADGSEMCLYYAPHLDSSLNKSIRLAPAKQPELSKFYFHYNIENGKIMNKAGYCISYVQKYYWVLDDLTIQADQDCQQQKVTTWTFRDQNHAFGTIRPYQKIDDDQNTLRETYTRRPKFCLSVQAAKVVLLNCVHEYANPETTTVDPSQRFFASMAVPTRRLSSADLSRAFIAPWHAP